LKYVFIKDKNTIYNFQYKLSGVKVTRDT